MSEPKFRRNLNNYQKDILLALYKFRFATRELIVKYQGLKSSTYTHYRLQNLFGQDYLGKRYSGEDKINRKPAVFFLLPKGMQALRAEPKLNLKAIANIYKDRDRADSFIERCVQIFRLYNKLNELYGDSLTFYTKTELSKYDFFPKPLPDGYLTVGNHNYLLEWLSASTPYPYVRGRLAQLITHYELEVWDESGMDYPTILFVCENQYLERQVQRLAKRLLSKVDEEDDIILYTTTAKALFNASDRSDLIWSDINDVEEPISLVQ